jgi:hypothetical protein
LIVLKDQEFLEDVELLQGKVKVIELRIITKEVFEDSRLEVMRDTRTYFIDRDTKQPIIILLDKPRVKL